MPKGPRGEKRPADVIGAAIKVAKIATGEIAEDVDEDGKDKAALRITPAMAAGLTDRVWSVEEFVALMDEAAPKPGRPKTYRKRTAA